MKPIDALMALVNWPDRWFERMSGEAGELFEAAEVLREKRSQDADERAAHRADDGRPDAYAAILYALIVRLHQYRLVFRLVAFALIGLLLLSLVK